LRLRPAEEEEMADGRPRRGLREELPGLDLTMPDLRFIEKVKSA